MKHFFTELVPCRTIQLSSSVDIYCIVDARDYEWAMQWTWNFNWTGWCGAPLYARRNIGIERTTLYLHRELMLAVSELPESYTSRRMVDHVNGQTLDCRRANLRWATARENRRNRRRFVPTLEHIVGTLPCMDVEIPF